MGFFFRRQKDTELVKNSFRCLTPSDIRVGLKAGDKYEAIRMAGRMLVENGSVEKPYIEGMIERENTVSTYIGSGIAIPHGVGTAKKYIKKTGIVVLQFPNGVLFGEEKAQLLVGIAGLADEHLPILQAVARVTMEEQLLEALKTTRDGEFVYRALTTGGEEK